MISLAADCLFFETALGQGIPLSAEMLTVELTGDNAGMFDPEFVKHATGAVIHYFKHELGRHTITVAEFAGALEKVLRGFECGAGMFKEPQAPARRPESDLRRLAHESGNGCELLFYPRLRNELRQQLLAAPQMVRFRGLRGCVKQLAGASRWCGRCRALQEQIVDFMRRCLTVESIRPDCSLYVD
jgi:hypothetical protein